MNTDSFELAPLLGYNPVWFWVMSFLVLAVLFLAVFYVLRTKNPNLLARDGAAFALDYVEEMDKVFVKVSQNQMSVKEGLQRVSLIMRAFYSMYTGVPAETMTAADLYHEDAPQPLLVAINSMSPILFGDKKVGSVEEFTAYMNNARAVIDHIQNTDNTEEEEEAG